MSYFFVDDQFPFHPKALAAGNAALGLWVRAGAWSKQYVTGGHVPRDIATSLGTRVEAERLVKAGLWVKVDGGYRFHDWQEIPGNLDAVGEKARRDESREKARVRKQRQRARQGAPTDGDGHASSHAGSHAVTGHDVTPGVTQDVPPPVTAPSRPPSVHSPHVKTSSVRPVPDRARDGRTDEGESDRAIRASVEGLDVDYDRILAVIEQSCDRSPSAADVARITATILARATTPPRSPTAFVVRSIRNDWAEAQKLIDSAEEAA